MRVAINGFGRIGRLFVRLAFSLPDVEIVAINSSRKISQLAHLLQYDSTYRTWDKEVSFDDDNFIIEGKKIRILEERKDTTKLPWKDLDIDLVIESTGELTKRELAENHITAGAKKVLITAPGKDVDAFIVVGVNDQILDLQKHNIISAASCTTNCLAPAVKVLFDKFGIVSGFMTTVHAYTMDQRLLDGTHKKDFRRARSAAINIVPTSTGAAKSIGKVIPELNGKMDGVALRVPVQTGSMVDLSVILEKQPSVDDIKSAYKEAQSCEPLKGILKYTEVPLVSSDYIGTFYSSIIDGLMLNKTGDIYKIFAWYDNEHGYASRVVDLAKKLIPAFK